MVLSFLRRCLALWSGADAASTSELLVLRHELEILRRQVARQGLRVVDRARGRRAVSATRVVRRAARDAGATAGSGAGCSARFQVSPTTVRRLLAQARLRAVPCRCGPSWREFLRARPATIVTCDSFTVESVFLRR